MIERNGRFLTSRVARRVVLLFVVAALVPLALMVLLSLTYVRATLIDQGHRRLAAHAKAYGMEVFSRLLDAGDLLERAANAGAGESSAPRSIRAFRSASVVSSDRKPVQLLGQPPDVLLTEPERSRLDAGERLLRVEARGETEASIVLAVPLGSGSGGKWAYAELDPSYLWGDSDSWPATTQFCVFEEASFSPLFCPTNWPRTAIGQIRGASSQAASHSIAWVAGGIRQTSATWGQFLRSAFGAGDWIIVATQPEDELLRPVVAFKRLFLPVSALALLVVVWLSLRLIRSTLTPLEQLTQATRRVVAHDFESRVEIARDDEFGELGDAFNSMTSRLARQFRALNALAEIDQEILSSRDLGRVVNTALRHLATLIPAKSVGVMLLDQHGGSHANTCVVETRHPNSMTTSRGPLSADQVAMLQSNAKGVWIATEGRAWQGVAGPLDPGGEVAYLHPIVWRGVLCGSLLFGMDARISVGDEEQAQIGEAAARLAVAVSSAWQDALLYRQAHYDVLTHLPNRLLFLDRLSQEIARCRREGTHLGLIFIDLDHFKKVNDTQGHSRGDAVLIEAARRLTECVRASDTVARLGGDEFTITAVQGARSAEVGRIVQQVLASLARPFELDGQRAYLGASLGVALFPTDGADAEELLKNADTAMYRAKANGRGQAAYFREAMNREAQERVQIERELHVALEREQFALFYQPQRDLRTGEIVGAEALIRWHHPGRGLVSPSTFIPVAEESGLIERIGRWTIRQACRELGRFRAKGIALRRVSANVSIRELYRSDYVRSVEDALRETECPATSLELEITESVLADCAIDVQAMLDGLRAVGVGLALDDFGTGYSSLASLRAFPVAVVKIDRSFIEGLPSSEQAVAIVRAMIAMAHALGKTVIAEGVENEAQLRTLRDLDCDLAQGYVISEPIPVTQFERFMRAESPCKRRAWDAEPALHEAAL